jgi:hypothetical protein
MRNDRADIFWAPPLKPRKVQALYLNDAQGLYDDEIIEEVGIGLLLRCRSIMEFTEALEGRVKCKRCAASGTTTILERKTARPDELLKCPVCGWQIQWRVYLTESEKTRGQLNAGHARAAFEAYLEAYPRSQSAKDKVLAIDRLIHEFHCELSGAGRPGDAVRTACVNLLDGTATEILDVLDGLACGENSDPALRAQRDSWAAKKPIARRRQSG